MCSLRDLGADTPIGRAYTEEEILAMVLKGKQRGYIAGRGRVVPGIGKTRLSSAPSGSYTTPEIDKMFAEKDKKIKEVEEEAKQTKAQLKAIMNVMKGSPELWSQLMSQMPSETEVGSGSGTAVGEAGSGSRSRSDETGSGSGETGTDEGGSSGDEIDIDGDSDDGEGH